jgi:hypothetical protein
LRGTKIVITTVGLQNIEDYMNPRDRVFEDYYNRKGRRLNINYAPDFRAILRATLARFPEIDRPAYTHIAFDCRRLRDPSSREEIRQHLGYHPEVLRQIATHEEMRNLIYTLMVEMQASFDRRCGDEVLSLIFICNHSRHRSVGVSWLVFALLKEMAADIVQYKTTPSPRTRGCGGHCDRCIHKSDADKASVLESTQIAEEIWDELVPRILKSRKPRDDDDDEDTEPRGDDAGKDEEETPVACDGYEGGGRPEEAEEESSPSIEHSDVVHAEAMKRDVASFIERRTSIQHPAEKSLDELFLIRRLLYVGDYEEPLVKARIKQIGDNFEAFMAGDLPEVHSLGQRGYQAGTPAGHSRRSEYVKEMMGIKTLTDEELEERRTALNRAAELHKKLGTMKVDDKRSSSSAPVTHGASSSSSAPATRGAGSSGGAGSSAGTSTKKSDKQKRPEGEDRQDEPGKDRKWRRVERKPPADGVQDVDLDSETSPEAAPSPKDKKEDWQGHTHTEGAG